MLSSVRPLCIRLWGRIDKIITCMYLIWWSYRHVSVSITMNQCLVCGVCALWSKEKLVFILFLRIYMYITCFDITKSYLLSLAQCHVHGAKSQSYYYPLIVRTGLLRGSILRFSSALITSVKTDGYACFFCTWRSPKGEMSWGDRADNQPES